MKIHPSVGWLSALVLIEPTQVLAVTRPQQHNAPCGSSAENTHQGRGQCYGKLACIHPVAFSVCHAGTQHQPTPREMGSRVRNTLGELVLIGAFIGHFAAELVVQQKLDSLPLLLPSPCCTPTLNWRFICRLECCCFCLHFNSFLGMRAKLPRHCFFTKIYFMGIKMFTVRIICLSDRGILTRACCCELHSETLCSFRAGSHSPPPAVLAFVLPFWDSAI